MKTTIEIDATPQELRALLGLPDVEPLQEEMLNKMRDKMIESIDSNDPMMIMKMFMPSTENVNSFQSLQEMFWQTVSKSVNVSGKDKKD